MIINRLSRVGVSRLLLVISLMISVTDTYAISILQTSPLGYTNGGTSILSGPTTQFLGVKFLLDQSYQITRLSGHVKGYSNTDTSLFVAINRLDTTTGLPTDVSLSDALYTNTFDAPSNDIGPYPYQVAPTYFDTSFILEAGSYSIMFGSGLFGATGSGWMPIASTSYGSQDYFLMGSYTGMLEFHDIDYQPAHFLVEG